jgi:hypothetical protein
MCCLGRIILLFMFDIRKTCVFLAPNRHLLGEGSISQLGQETKMLGGPYIKSKQGKAQVL